MRVLAPGRIWTSANRAVSVMFEPVRTFGMISGLVKAGAVDAPVGAAAMAPSDVPIRIPAMSAARRGRVR
jgi:hypothetical protein